MIPLAHGVGVRADLPIPLGLALFGSGTAVLVSFLAVVLLWRRSRLRGDDGGTPLPRALAAVLDSPVLRWVLRLVVLALTGVVIAAGLTGPVDPPQNIAPWAFYVTFWVGLVPVSLLLGPVWKVVNPLRTLHTVLRPLTGPAPMEGRAESLGYWPAAAAALAYTWLELCYSDRSAPSTVAVFLVVYGVVQLVAALWFGEGWFARGDAFEVYSSLLGRLAPFGRRADGALVVRNPLDGIDGLRAERGLAGVVVVFLGGTAFDGVTRTVWWQGGPGIQGDAVTLPQTIWLAITVLAVGGLYLGATTIGGLLSGVKDAPALFAHSLVPIVAGYAIAHYFSLLLLEGQLTWILISDPFQQGWDLFGTAANAVDFTAVQPATISNTQVAAIVTGHVVGVLLAHDRAVRLAHAPALAPSHEGTVGDDGAMDTVDTGAASESGRREVAAQLPLLLVMIGFTVGGIALLLGA